MRRLKRIYRDFSLVIYLDIYPSKNYKDYGYKNTTVNNDPILFFNKVTDIKPKQDVIYTENGTVNVKKVKFEG